VAAGNLAVVELTRNGASGICTGYFITRRHIVTAAHCTDRNYASQWYKVKIKTGNTTFVSLKQSDRTDTWVLMTETVHPRFNFDQETAYTDTAILTIPSTASGSVPANQERLRIGTASPATGQNMGIWGWGALTAGDTAPPGNLYSGRSGDEISVASVGTQSGDRRFTAIVNNGARTCKGDSGGPATRFLAGNYVAFGTHRGSDAVGCATTASTMYWAATSDKASWIETTLKGVYGSGFTCSRYGSGSDAYMRCW
jgi:secreted trypsin-like serine protease